MFEHLSLYGAGEVHFLIPGKTLVAIGGLLGLEWAFTQWLAMSVEAPLFFMASAPSDYRATYFMPGLSAGWRF